MNRFFFSKELCFPRHIQISLSPFGTGERSKKTFDVEIGLVKGLVGAKRGEQRADTKQVLVNELKKLLQAVVPSYVKMRAILEALKNCFQFSE